MNKKILFFIILFIPFFSHSNSPLETLYNRDLKSSDIPSKENIELHKQRIKREFPERRFLFDVKKNQNILGQYGHLDPNKVVPTKLLKKAVLFFDSNKSSFRNKKYITVMDFSKRSNRSRMFIINMNSGHVWPIHTSHGRGGDKDHDGYVESLSNVSGSKKSSRGFYKVAEIYYGKHGRSVRLDGLSSTNSRARTRAIVVHGSNYVKEANVIQGRSWGCFALAWSVKNKVLDKISGGSLMYAERSK